MPAASRTVRIAAKLGGVLLAKVGGMLLSMPGKTWSIATLAAGLRMMSISGLALENGMSRKGQSVNALAWPGLAISAASAATAKVMRFMVSSPLLRCFGFRLVCN